jgi:hypothetical protein
MGGGDGADRQARHDEGEAAWDAGVVPWLRGRRLAGLGAAVTARHPDHAVMADPEGNGFCVDPGLAAAADAPGPAGHAEMVVIFEGRTWPAAWRGPGRRTEQERVDGCRGLVSGWPGR